MYEQRIQVNIYTWAQTGNIEIKVIVCIFIAITFNIIKTEFSLVCKITMMISKNFASLGLFQFFKDAFLKQTRYKYVMIKFWFFFLCYKNTNIRICN